MSELTQKIESLLFYRQQEVSLGALARATGAGKEAIEKALAELAEAYEGHGITLLVHDGAAEIVTAGNQSDFIKEVAREEVNTDLTSPQSEALALIAYLAPVGKVRIDFIRGVNSRAVLRNLSARGLVQDSTTDGKTRYTLTSDALAHLGVSALSELPDYQETRTNLQEFTQSEEVAEELEALS